MSEAMIFWLILLIVAIVTEVITLGLTSIWFAGGALVAIFVAVLHGPLWLQIVLFFSGIPVTAVFHKTGCSKVL